MSSGTLVHVADIFRGELSDDAIADAKESIGLVPVDDPIIDSFECGIRDIHVDFRRTEVLKFIDWVIRNNLHKHVDRLAAFIRRIAERLSHGAANKMMRTNRVLPAHARGAYDYFQDSIHANALDLLYESTYKRIVLIETVERTEIEYTRFVTKKVATKAGPPITRFYDEVRQVPGLLINGKFKVVSTGMLTLLPEMMLNHYTLLTEMSECDGVWSGGTILQNSQSTSLLQMAVGVARANHVAMEVGRMSHRHSYVTEHADSKWSRDIDRQFDIVAARECFLSHLDETQSDVFLSMLFATECDRLELMAIDSQRGEFGRYVNAHEFYRMKTNDNPHKSSFYRNLNEVNTMFDEWLSQNWEDLKPAAKPIPRMEVGTPVKQKETFRTNRRHLSAVSLLTRNFAKVLPSGVNEAINVELNPQRVNGFDIPMWSVDIETWAPVKTSYKVNDRSQTVGIVMDRQTVTVFYTDTLTGHGDGI